MAARVQAPARGPTAIVVPVTVNVSLLNAAQHLSDLVAELLLRDRRNQQAVGDLLSNHPRADGGSFSFRFHRDRISAFAE